MNRVLPLLLTLGVLLSPSQVFAAAFEDHSSWDTEPRLETEKGISKGMAVLEMYTGMRFLWSENYFNSNGKVADAPHQYDMMYMDVGWHFGFTENWTFWTNIPIVWSEDSTTDAAGELIYDRKSSGKIGDANTGIIYQFFRRNDPTISMGMGLRWKLPTGSESPGANSLNITGTGTTDVELSFLGRLQLFRYMALGWAAGYNIRFPETVQYIIDRHTSITNAGLDLGDEIYAQLDIIAAFDYMAFQLSGRFTYRRSSALAIAEYRAETIRWQNPATGEVEESEMLLFNGARYQDWDVVAPNGDKVSSAGYIFTLTPRLILRPLEWLDITAFAQFHLMGKNTRYLVNKDGNNATIENFEPMQVLGKEIVGGLILGEFGVAITGRY
ncbi:MAG: hypothetical protein JRF33_02255 [Deltaproteobacteria bacterium]|nr:hypothetical protein [Deltaproteobacteria bacterium]